MLMKKTFQRLLFRKVVDGLCQNVSNLLCAHLLATSPQMIRGY